MASFAYKARNNAGEAVTGTLEAASEQEVLHQLRQLKYTPVAVSRSSKADAKAAPKFDLMNWSSTKGVKVRDMVVFCTNLSSMTSSGVPLLGALNMISGQMGTSLFGNVLRQVSQKVSEGASFSEALKGFPDIFSKFFVNMVHVGEISGTMDEVLRVLTVYMEKQENLRQTLKGMMIYPTILLCAGLGVISLILIFVMPQFVQIFTKAGVPLPLPTEILNQVSIWLRKFWWLLGIGLTVLFVSAKMYFKTDNGRDFRDRWVLKIPLVGPVIQKSLVARFSRTLGAMIGSGVPLLQSLGIVQQVLENKVFERIVGEVYTSAEKGEGIHRALMAHPEFPQDVTYMISVGESSGNMAAMLGKVADFYENKVQLEIKDLVVLIEPAFISLMGIGVGGILASMILPMFDMIKTIKH